jgi:hypothetical protein
MRHPSGAIPALVARARGRARLRAITVITGVAGVAAAGVIAVNLPAGTHPKAGSSTTTNLGSSSTSGTSSSSDEGASGDDGSSRGDGSATVLPGTSVGSASTGSQVHATSGGS